MQEGDPVPQSEIEAVELDQDSLTAQQSQPLTPRMDTLLSQPPMEPRSVSTTQPLEAMFLAQQVPLIGKFSGEPRAGDPKDFTEWLEQFELVANVCQWTEQTKLYPFHMRTLKRVEPGFNPGWSVHMT